MRDFATAASCWLSQYKSAVESLSAEAVASLFAENASYYETPFGPVFAGKESVLAYWKDVASVPRGVAYDFKLIATHRDEAVFQWTMRILTESGGAEIDGVSIAQLRPDANLCTKLVEWRHRRDTPSLGSHH